MTLNFTEQEMIIFLKKRGYTIEEIPTYNTYYNELVDRVTLIAYKIRPNITGTPSGVSMNSQYGIETTFRMELKEALLSL
jgi:hypothetical protein